ALLALKNTYHKNLRADGPKVVEALQEGKEITVSFSNVKKLKTEDGKTLSGFEVMNEKGEIFPVSGNIQNTDVVLALPKRDKIIKVLYAFQPFIRANLVNEAGLPASTFSLKVKQE
ncbi:MAG TPA: sialate O-acetylesterase, partial [Hanamia sp.]|nr:sialate O-acetylesterase [Hanamia sp.]